MASSAVDGSTSVENSRSIGKRALAFSSPLSGYWESNRKSTTCVSPPSPMSRPPLPGAPPSFGMSPSPSPSLSPSPSISPSPSPSPSPPELEFDPPPQETASAGAQQRDR